MFVLQPGEKLDKLHKEHFWQDLEVYERFRRPPAQIERKLTRSHYKPGERAALGLFWRGLSYYSYSLKTEEDLSSSWYCQTGDWLDTFKKAAKAFGRLGDSRKTTSHNLELFNDAWSFLYETAREPMDVNQSGLIEEAYSGFWISSYCFWMAASHLRNSLFFYDKGAWTIGFQTEDEAMPTSAREIEYDRLLLRSSLICFNSQIDKLRHLLPSNPDGWMLANQAKDCMAPLSYALKDVSSSFEDFVWTEKPFKLSLDNNCKIFCERYTDVTSSSKEKHGLALVFTPYGMFIEDYPLTRNNLGDEDSVEDSRAMNSLLCQPYNDETFGLEYKEEKRLKEYIRERIFLAIQDSHFNTSLQEPIDREDKRDIGILTSASQGPKRTVPRGHILYGPF